MEIIYSKQAKNYLDAQTQGQSNRIKRAIELLPAGDIKKLRGLGDAYRLRVGSVRILFEKQEESIHIIRVDNRGDVYK
jgi:mRNA interferase RelE/StbE